MLKSLDILIGFSVIMLALSVSVTVVIHWILHLLGLRGRELSKGIIVLLQHLAPELQRHGHAAQIAGRVLTHPLLARAGGHLAPVLRREDLLQLLLEIAAGASGPAPANFRTPEQALAAALDRLGIPHPARTLESLRLHSMRLEGSLPGAAPHLRDSLAAIAEADSLFVAHLHQCFDSTIDRVSQSFTDQSRYWTTAVSLLVALVLQLDALQLINRLALDANQRLSPLLTWPHSWPDWRNGWTQSSIFGVLLTAMLLSLGAPFWFHLLGDLIQLRPVAASKLKRLCPSPKNSSGAQHPISAADGRLRTVPKPS